MGRMERVNEQMKREISQMLRQDFQDPRLTLVTILGVEVSKDLQHAVVYYSVLGDEAKVTELGEVLERLKGYIRKLVGQRVRMRYTPELRFEYDRSILHSARIEQTLSEIKEKMPFDHKDS